MLGALDLWLNLAQLVIVRYMPGIDWSFFLVIAPIVIAALLGVFGFLWQKQAKRAGNMDNNAWLLIILIIVAILSIGCFIAFIFLRCSVG